MRNVLYEWVSCHICPRRHMALAFYSASRNRMLFVAFPLNYIVALAWWAQDKWARKANAPSWIDNEVENRRKLYDAFE